ncbi:hypothetical protein ABZY44_21925 [Streptomyces sp. NPDC006544]|uniref:hypothetical protein n=1 Tax=Streptomyces sp. NPDC006544 TaxID=3154583 RepID=UPI0033B7A8BB
MTVQPGGRGNPYASLRTEEDLWRPGWEAEPCDTAEPESTDQPRAYRKTITVGSVDDYEPQEQR